MFIVVLLAVFIHGQGAGGGKNRNSDHQEPSNFYIRFSKNNCTLFIIRHSFVV